MVSAYDFNPKEYWATRDKKVWVVRLVGPGKKPRRDTKYVRASTEQGAIRTARYFSSMKRVSWAFAELATPKDLGCTLGDVRLVPRAGDKR